ncbi:hypothetical protein VCHA53O466_50018 [Vibrio chagasii]|nr:hypothetical protein VCHA53O466_50018 [Vibrio chagasii]
MKIVNFFKANPPLIIGVFSVSLMVTSFITLSVMIEPHELPSEVEASVVTNADDQIAEEI